MTRKRLFAIFLLIAIPSIALGQEVAPEPEAVTSIWDTIGKIITVWLPRATLICGLISAAVPSVGKVMGLIDIFAVNWGKARNDASVQSY